MTSISNAAAFGAKLAVQLHSWPTSVSIDRAERIVIVRRGSIFDQPRRTTDAWLVRDEFLRMNAETEIGAFVGKFGGFHQTDVQRVHIQEVMRWQESVEMLLLANTRDKRAAVSRRLAAWKTGSPMDYDDIDVLIGLPLSVPSPLSMKPGGEVVLETQGVLAAIVATVQIDWFTEKKFLRCLDDRCRRLFDATGMDPRQTHCPRTPDRRGNGCAKRKGNRDHARRERMDRKRYLINVDD
jgi:hypothetical protein